MNKALFLDRDGVVNVEINYLYKKEDFIFIEGVLELCKHFQKLGYIIIIVTNQSGIARGYYDENAFESLSAWMLNEFSKNGIEIKKVYYCPHHPEISGECICRKPNPGMILKAKDEFNLDLENSILVGDKESDIEAALAAGVKTTYLFDAPEEVKFTKASKKVSKLGDIYNVDFK